MGARIHLGHRRHYGMVACYLLYCEGATVKDETIRVGDLVMVVRFDDCCEQGNLGTTYTVKKIEREPANKYSCRVCLRKIPHDRDIYFYSDDRGFAYSRLKKIHPPELDEPVNERREVTA